MYLERRRQIEELYRAAVAQPPDARDAFLAGACGSDKELRRELDSLLAHSAEPTGTLVTETEWGAGGMADPGTILAPGTRLGPYQIVGPLGRGGMGRVYRGLDTRLDRPVAIKISVEQFSGQFEGEVRAISALNHPHICTLYDVGSNFLVMELVEGETLFARLGKGPCLWIVSCATVPRSQASTLLPTAKSTRRPKLCCRCPPTPQSLRHPRGALTVIGAMPASTNKWRRINRL